jgi:hypothetical protein
MSHTTAPATKSGKVKFVYQIVKVVKTDDSIDEHYETGFTINDGACIIFDEDSIWGHVYARGEWKQVYGDWNEE